MSRAHSRLAQARTVLIANVPDELCDEKELTGWASFVSGGVQKVWIYGDTTVSALEFVFDVLSTSPSCIGPQQRLQGAAEALQETREGDGAAHAVGHQGAQKT